MERETVARKSGSEEEEEEAFFEIKKEARSPTEEVSETLDSMNGEPGTSASGFSATSKGGYNDDFETLVEVKVEPASPSIIVKPTLGEEFLKRRTNSASPNIEVKKEPSEEADTRSGNLSSSEGCVSTSPTNEPKQVVADEEVLVATQNPAVETAQDGAGEETPLVSNERSDNQFLDQLVECHEMFQRTSVQFLTNVILITILVIIYILLVCLVPLRHINHGQLALIFLGIFLFVVFAFLLFLKGTEFVSRRRQT